MRWTLGPIVIVMMMLAVACGGEDAPATSTPDGGTGTGPSGAMGPGLSIAEARASTAAGPLLVRGFLVAHDGRVQLCEALAESFPPQCGGDSLTVSGLDLDARDDLEEAEGTRWSPSEIALLGDVAGDTLTVDATATG